MNSQRRKREQEIERLLRGEGLTREAELEFQEEIRKASAAIVQEDAARLVETEKVRHRPFGSGVSTGAWLLAAGVIVSLFAPPLGAVLVAVAGGMLVWGWLRPQRNHLSRRTGPRQ